MGQENRISIALTAAEEKAITEAQNVILSILEGKAISLQPYERQMYGRVKYEKEVFIDNNKTEMDANAQLVPDWIDKRAFDQDYTAHKVLKPLIDRQEKILHLMQDTNLLLGYDLDTAANGFYNYVKMAAKNNVPGARTIYENLKQQYPGKRSRPENKEEK